MIRSFTPFKPYHFTLGVGGGLSVRGLVLDVQSIQVTFSQCVDITDTTGIQVNIGGAGWEEISAVSSGSAKTWILATTTVIAESDTVEWQYLGSEDSIVDCVDALDVGVLGPKTLTNGLELTAPTLESSEVGIEADTVFYLTFSEPVASTDFTLGWTIEADAVELTIEEAEVYSPGVIRMVVTESVYEGQTVTISYDDGVGDIVDVSGYPDGNALASITDESVTNNSETPIPILWSRDLTTLDLGADDTFGRASAGYHQQPAAHWFAGFSAEPRFYGARRYENYCYNTSNIPLTTVIPWYNLTSNPLVSGQPDPFGGNNAYLVQPAAANQGIVYLGKTLTATTRTTGAIWVKWVSGNTANFRLMYNSLSAGPLITISSAWQRFAYSLNQAAGVRADLRIADTNASGQGSFQIYCPQIEYEPDLTAPSETVLTGATDLSRQRYSLYANGNTIGAGNVVTEATGAALPGPFGLLMEPLRTNYLLNSGAPVTQTTGSLGIGTYCLWVEGTGSAAVTAGSATITGGGTASAGSPDVFEVTGAGTVDVTITGTLTKFQLEAGAEPSSFILTAGAIASRAIDTLDYTDDELNNETRIVKRLVSDPGTEVIVDIDDWDYTVPAPTAPQFIQRIDVYAPGERPVL